MGRCISIASSGQVSENGERGDKGRRSLLRSSREGGRREKGKERYEIIERGMKGEGGRRERGKERYEIIERGMNREGGRRERGKERYEIIETDSRPPTPPPPPPDHQSSPP